MRAEGEGELSLPLIRNKLDVVMVSLMEKLKTKLLGNGVAVSLAKGLVVGDVGRQSPHVAAFLSAAYVGVVFGRSVVARDRGLSLVAVLD